MGALALPAAGALANGAPPAKSAPARSNADLQGFVERYCGAFGQSSADARVSAQMKQLADMMDALKKRTAELEAEEARAKEWMSKRDDILRRAGEATVAIYAKMRPDAAAAQLAEMDDDAAAAIVGKLGPRGASAVLNEMNPAKAASLAAAMTSAMPPSARGR